MLSHENRYANHVELCAMPNEELRNHVFRWFGPAVHTPRSMHINPLFDRAGGAEQARRHYLKLAAVARKGLPGHRARRILYRLSRERWIPGKTCQRLLNEMTRSAGTGNVPASLRGALDDIDYERLCDNGALLGAPLDELIQVGKTCRWRDTSFALHRLADRLEKKHCERTFFKAHLLILNHIAGARA